MISKTELLQHALIGYEQQQDEIQRKIEDLKRRLKGTADSADRPKRRLSPEGRAAIVKATKERWRRKRAESRKS